MQTSTKNPGTAQQNTTTIEGVELTVAGEDFTVLDLTLATHLEMAQPRNIRQLVKKYEKSGDLGAVQQRTTSVRYESRPGIWQERKVVEYHLTEEQALFVITKSETAKANELTRKMIRVFLQARKNAMGALPPAKVLAQLTTMGEQLAAVTAQLTVVSGELATLRRRPEYAGGVIGPREAGANVRGPLLSLARQLANVRDVKQASVLLRLNNKLRRMVSFPNDAGQGWDNFPVTRYGELTSALGLLQHDAKAEIKAHVARVAREAQLSIDEAA